MKLEGKNILIAIGITPVFVIWCFFYVWVVIPAISAWLNRNFGINTVGAVCFLPMVAPVILLILINQLRQKPLHQFDALCPKCSGTFRLPGKCPNCDEKLEGRAGLKSNPESK
jgi:hypothetical protein